PHRSRVGSCQAPLAKYKERGTVLAEDQLAQVGDPPLPWQWEKPWL
uniref:Uncharacterized protein n=1 Tax=Buteo japonicus TaxID=224669 RepID=A0A8C0B9A3_9AVES